MAKELRSILAKNVRKARATLGVSQDELSHRSGLHRTYVGGIERGERNISLKSLAKLAQALGVEPSWLIGEDEQ